MHVAYKLSVAEVYLKLFPVKYMACDFSLNFKQHRTSLECLRFKFLNGSAWENAEIVPMACSTADPFATSFV